MVPKTTEKCQKIQMLYPHSEEGIVFVCQKLISNSRISEQIQWGLCQSFDTIWRIPPSDKTP
jgi:hypothetical protein